MSGSGHFIGLLEFAADPCAGLYETTSGLESRLALGRTALERDAFRRNRKGDSFFCANQIHHSGR
ncbi:hypothetical protein CN090_34460 [Sinorhizobium meliloti]|nr:hypothetical protein CN104_33480 [Sinorhizobium meliloti]RVO15822.1 hypothetical protein CN100_33680 [Sinorhizobium meliloti]RVO39576.1 hypothetical protein CN090_34460 [Sinorhizobium meliloti]